MFSNTHNILIHNFRFGASILSPSTGVIFNNEMDDFSYPNITNAFDIPPSPNNFVKPGKIPLSSMVPTIILDRNGDVRLVVGASGGTKITSNVALVSVRDIFFNMNVKQAIDAKRMHHQLSPMLAYYEEGFTQVRAL
jgi:gamma-glutamyltranspeptidase/glutathione hydrolase/leukotriene-C4 hydrolase